MNVSSSMNSRTGEDYYKILEVDRQVDADGIKRAFRRLSLKNHPDKISGGSGGNAGARENTEKFKKIMEAYEVLGDPEKRRQYDMCNLGSMGGGMGGYGNVYLDTSNRDFSLEKIQEAIERQVINPDASNMELFRMLFSKHHANTFPQQSLYSSSHQHPSSITSQLHTSIFNKPEAINKTLEISLAQAFAGCILPIEIERNIQENNVIKQEIETLYVAIPKGVDNNELIVLKDKGHTLSDILCGDVKIYIKVSAHNIFERNGINLIYNKTISLKESLCGFSFPISHIDGRSYIINNESGNIISNNYQKIIPNLGMEREDHRGNLIIKFRVEYPEKLSSVQVEKLREIL
jgi:DnaJ-class molecular chaperone